MKTNELLYEMMSEVSEQEAELLDGLMQDGKKMDKEYEDKQNIRKENIHRNEYDNLRRQEKLTMDKIKSQMQKDDKSRIHLISRHRIALIAAVMVMLMGITAFAREQDWDIEMAEQIGLAGVMEKLDGGYVRIGESVTQDGVTVTALQSIGDQNSQWIQFDTDIPWTAGEKGYYMFDDTSTCITRNNGRIVTGGTEFYSYNNNGYVSFMLYAMGYENINRTNVQIELGTLRQYEDTESEGILVSDGHWKFAWNNYYSANTITKYPHSMVDDLLVYKVELSPVSVRIEAVGIPFKEHDFLVVESVTLRDGMVVSCQEDLVSGSTNNTFFDSYVIYGDKENIDMEKVESITVNGKEVKLH